MTRIQGYAVVCQNDCIADADGDMPNLLKTDAEWEFFQAGLDAADVIVLGRKSHEVTPNPKSRRRLVMTRGVSGAERAANGAVFWNPAGAALGDALALFECQVRQLAVTGGQGVFDHFLTGPDPYDQFFLSRISGARLRNGRKVFSNCRDLGLPAEAVLRDTGFAPGEARQLDAISSVVGWARIR